MGPAFPDCESCAFYESETVVCEDCEDADQWEPAEPEDLLGQNIKPSLKKLHILKFYREKKAA